MQARTSGVAAAVALATAVAGGTVWAQEGGPRAFVLDQTAHSLTAIDVASGRVEQTAALQGAPHQLLRSADGRRLLVLDRGEGKDAGDNGYQAKTRAALTIVDGRTLAVGPRIELGWGLDASPMLDAAGDRLSVVSPGFTGRNAPESLPRELITVDLAAGKVVSRLELPRRATASLATPDGKIAVVLSAREDAKKTAPALPAELRFVDLTAGTVLATVPLDGDPRGPVLAPDRQVVYLLDRGKPNNNPEKNVNGKLHAVSMTTHAVQVTDAGSKPRGLVLDERGQQLLLVSDGTPVQGPANKDRPGALRVIRGGAPSAPIAVTSAPERLEVSDDGKTLYVLGMPGLTRVALPGLAVQDSVKASGIGYSDAAISRDGRRAYSLYGEYFTTHDLEKGVQVAQVRTGRMGKKMLLALETGLDAETKRLEAQNEARRQGRSYYGYTEYTLAAPHGTMAIRPDGKMVYALNSQTSDVTVIDGDTGEVIEKVAAGGFAVKFLTGASVALVADSDAVHAVDLTTHQKLADVVAAPGAYLSRAEVSPDGKLAVVHGSGGVVVVSAAGGKPVGTLKTFSKVADVVVDWGRAR